MFLLATDENESTTLREGSDYTAAILANLLQASIKPLEGCSGVMNADLKEYAEAQLIKELNYREVIEDGVLRAQVIHPKLSNHYRIKTSHCMSGRLSTRRKELLFIIKWFRLPPIIV